MTSKVALVTASSAGLGAAIAKALASDFRVVINYSQNSIRADETLSELNSLYSQDQSLKQKPESCSATRNDPASTRFLSIRADISTRSSITQLVDEVVERMGQLDLVVSNGGWTRIRDFKNLDDNVEEDDWDRCWNVNVKSHLWLIHAARKFLESSDNGAFVSVASIAGVKPSGSSIAYAVTKAAQVHLIKCLAGVVGPKVRVNCVSPGILMTDWGRQFPEDKLKIAKEKTVLKRFATVEDVANQVKTMALSRSITGMNAIVDSGFSL